MWLESCFFTVGCACQCSSENVENPYIALNGYLSVSFTPVASHTRTNSITRSRCATLVVPYHISLPSSSSVYLDVELGLVLYHRHHSFTYIAIHSFISSDFSLRYTCSSPSNTVQYTCFTVLCQWSQAAPMAFKFSACELSTSQLVGSD